MTRDEALKALRECPVCRRWITVHDCDTCWANNHRCPPTPAQALSALKRAVALGAAAAKMQEELRLLLPEPSA